MSVATAINQLQSKVKACDVATLNADELAAATSAVRGLERSLHGLTLRIGQRADALAASGDGPAAAENFRRGGSVSDKRARSEAKRAKTAARMPGLGDALSNGETSDEHLDAVTAALRGLDESEKEAFAEEEDSLVSSAKRLPPEQFRKKVQRAAQRARKDTGEQNAEAQRRASSFSSWTDRDGMGHFRGTLDPERFAAFVGAIERHTASLANRSGEQVQKNPNLAAAALCDLVAGGNGRQGRTHVSLVVDEHTAAHGQHPGTVRETSNGTPVTHTAAGRLLCDAVLQRVVLDPQGVPLDVGRKHRTATDAQWTALKAIYRTCAMCDLSVDWCQAHHLDPWHPPPTGGWREGRGQRGGLTNLDNLVPVCCQDHHLLHEGGYTAKLRPDRTLEVFQPDGSLWKTLRPDRFGRSEGRV